MDKLPAVTMPSLDHLGTADYQHVYEPSDDTFLLCDALSADVAVLRGRRPTLCVELGSGSGAVITHLGTVLPVHSTALLATDVNPAAAVASRATGAANAQRVEVGLMDLLSAVRPGTVDVLVFNPPYVPTSSEELVEAEGSRDISASWAGGVRGREVRSPPSLCGLCIYSRSQLGRRMRRAAPQGARLAYTPTNPPPLPGPGTRPPPPHDWRGPLALGSLLPAGCGLPERLVNRSSLLSTAVCGQCVTPPAEERTIPTDTPSSDIQQGAAPFT